MHRQLFDRIGGNLSKRSQRLSKRSHRSINILQDDTIVNLIESFYLIFLLQEIIFK